MSDIKKGDKVLIYRKYDGEDWRNVWVEEMDFSVGKIGVVIDGNVNNTGFYVSYNEFKSHCFHQESLIKISDLSDAVIANSVAEVVCGLID